MNTPRPTPGASLRSRAGVDEIYGDLREQIVSVQLRPGEALSEARIAQSYGVSRTPVREAFKRLADEGLMRVVPQVGSFVAPIDLRAVRDNHFVRETLECRIVELAAQRIAAGEREALQDNLRQQERAMAADDPAAFFRADEAMHRMIARIAGHESVWQVIHDAKGQLDRVRRLSLADSTRSRYRMREHRAIVQRIAKGDSEGAARAMRSHLDSIFDAISNIAAENAHYFVGGNDLPADGRFAERLPARSLDRHKAPAAGEGVDKR